MNACQIIHIQSDYRQVKIDFRYTNCHGFGGWVNINPNCFIRPVGTNLHYTLISAEGITMAPENITFHKDGDILFFSLIFPPLPYDICEIDLIEDEDNNDAFNFFNVSLTMSTYNMIPMSLSTQTETSILKRIESIALEIKDTSKKTKSYKEELVRLETPLLEISQFLKLSTEETAVFSLGIYIAVTTDSFSINDLKKFANFSPFDIFEIKKTVKQLLKKGWIMKGDSIGVHRGLKRTEERKYFIHPLVMETLYKNMTPEIKKKDVDVYSVAEYLHTCLQEHCHEEIETEELVAIIADYEEEYAEINPFKIAKELNLDETEKRLLYYMVTKMTIGDDIIDVDRMLSHLFKNRYDKLVIKKMLSQKNSLLFTDNYIEFVNEDFKTDKFLKITQNGIDKLFGEDACFLVNVGDFSAGICKLIKYDTIEEKELFYNDEEWQAIQSVTEFLKAEKYTEIVRKLKENKMRSGLTILLHGYPGTGKTETIYQLARQTERHILLVNISEIRDKWVGESEKRLKSVFDTYKASLKHFDKSPILLFNESDALIGKRINVNTSVDQMNNAMQNILLQELEDFSGILMATTNLTSNLDEAFERRFLYKIKYAKPSLKAKAMIWKTKLNQLCDSEAMQLAEEFELSGGQIENISRKIFLDSVLFNKPIHLNEIVKYCEDEMLITNHKGRKIGF